MLNLQIDSSSLDRLIARLQEAPALIERQLHAGLVDATQDVYDEVERRTPVKSGHLRDTLTARVEGSGAGARGIVGFSADYAPHVEYPTRPHTIRAKGKTLRFQAGGRVVYAPSVQHPGTQGAHMLALGSAAARARVRRRFSARLGVVTRRLAGR